MLFWFGELKYILPPDMSGPFIHAALFQSKKLLEAVRTTMKKNILFMSISNKNEKLKKNLKKKLKYQKRSKKKLKKKKK